MPPEEEKKTAEPSRKIRSETLKNGDIYEGEWLDDYRDGKGKLTSKDGIYEGEFKKNLRHGKGKYTWISGDRKGAEYEGEWKNDNREGKGV